MELTCERDTGWRTALRAVEGALRLRTQALHNRRALVFSISARPLGAGRQAGAPASTAA
jgi:hypothetical protein